MRSRGVYRLCFLSLLLLLCSYAPHVDTALRYVGTRETHGPNRSPVIDRWNRAVGVPLGSPYCASAVSAWLQSSGNRVILLRSARARSFANLPNAIPAKRVITGQYKPRRGDIVVWTRSGGGISASSKRTGKGRKGGR